MNLKKAIAVRLVIVRKNLEREAIMDYTTYFIKPLKRALKNYVKKQQQDSETMFEPVLRTLHNAMCNYVSVFVIGELNDIYCYRMDDKFIAPVFFSEESAKKYSLNIAGHENLIHRYPLRPFIYEEGKLLIFEPDEIGFIADLDLLKAAKSHKSSANIALVNADIKEIAADMIVVPTDAWFEDKKIEKELAKYYAHKYKTPDDDVLAGSTLSIEENTNSEIDADYYLYNVYPSDIVNLAGAHNDIFEKAKIYNVQSVAIPCMNIESSDYFAVIKHSVNSLIQLLSDNKDYPLDIYLFDSDQTILHCYQIVLSELAKEIQDSH